jgi:hypothetical protein
MAGGYGAKNLAIHVLSSPSGEVRGFFEQFSSSRCPIFFGETA